MPPKKGDQPKKKKTTTTDSTFGMKNKKGAKGQKAVEAVQKSRDAGVMRSKMQSQTPEEKMKEDMKKAKAAAAAAAEEFKLLQRASIKQKPLEPGVDPKSVVCEFFRAGCCDKGARCKYAHDLTVTKKSAKLDIYSDRREGADGNTEDDKNKDGIEGWDQAKLEQAVATKHGAEGGGHLARPTDIVCKFFLDAIEKELYGWFWTCPNGGSTCKYRHALPPGFVFKTKRQREEEQAAKLAGEQEDVDIGELIEIERAKLPNTGLTKVTADTFKAWKEARDKRKLAEMKTAVEESAKKGNAGGKDFKIMSGRALFTFNPDLFVDDADADEEVYSDDGGESDADGDEQEDGRGNAEEEGGVVVEEDDEEELQEGDESDENEEENDNNNDLVEEEEEGEDMDEVDNDDDDDDDDDDDQVDELSKALAGAGGPISSKPPLPPDAARPPYLPNTIGKR
jgi:hypothetical protein